MKYVVRYLSKSGNTKKVAEAIANELKINAETIDNDIDNVDILFLGSAMYAFMLPGEIKKFIKGLDSNKVKKVVVFSTTASSLKVHGKISKLLKKKGIECLEDNYYCPGAFSESNVGRPNEEDLKRAKEFARNIVGEVK